MTDAQRIELRAAEARRELRALALDDNATGDAIQTATAKLNDLETRAAVLTATEDASSSPAIETDTTGEGAEFRSLEKRAKVSDFVGAAVGTAPGGRCGRGILGCAQDGRGDVSASLACSRNSGDHRCRYRSDRLHVG